MHGWIDGSAVQPGCGGSMTARRRLANTPCFSRSRGVLKNEDLKPLDSCAMLEFNFTLKGASDVFEMRFDHEGQDIKRWFKDRKLEKVVSPHMNISWQTCMCMVARTGARPYCHVVGGQALL